MTETLTRKEQIDRANRMVDMFQCRTCGKLVAGRTPKGGDGSAYLLVRHGPRPGCPDRGLYPTITREEK